MRKPTNDDYVKSCLLVWVRAMLRLTLAYVFVLLGTSLFFDVVAKIEFGITRQVVALAGTAVMLYMLALFTLFSLSERTRK